MEREIERDHVAINFDEGDERFVSPCFFKIIVLALINLIQN